MQVTEISDLLSSTLKIKGCSLCVSDYCIAINILKAAPTLSFLKKLIHLELKKHQNKQDAYTIKIDGDNNRLAFKKVSEDSVSIISIILK